MNENQEINITLTAGDPKTFRTIQELKSWCQQEKEYWSWLQTETRYDLISSLYNLIIYTYNLEELIRYLDLQNEIPDKEKKIAEKINYFNNNFKERRLFLSTSPTGRYINNLVKEKGNLIAAFATLFLVKYDPQTTIQKLTQEHRLFYVATEGFFLAMTYKHGFHDRTEDVRKALEDLYSQWNNQLEDCKTNLENFKSQNTQSLEEFSQTKLLKQKDFDELSDTSKTEFKEVIEKSKTELKNIERTYDEKLALHSSVKYWEDKAKKHKKASIWFGASTLIIFSCLFGTICYFIYEFIGAETRPMDIHIWKYGVVFSITIFAVWIIRIFVRLLLSNLHLRYDADERRTMLLTYLALLREGQGPSERHREIILQTIFRPAAFGLLKDDALPPIVAQWIKQITSNE